MMIFKTRRKRLRVSEPSSGEESPEEVVEFGPDEASESDFEESASNVFSQDIVPATAAIHITEGSNVRDVQSWVERYSLITAQSGPATSVRKTKDITSWVSRTLTGHGSGLLVLAGPPGSGKCSAVRLAAKEMGCEVVEWHAPATGTKNISHTLLDDFYSFFVGGRYVGLNVEDDDRDEERKTTSRKILLVKDLPLDAHDILQKRAMLQNVFTQAAKYAPYLTVIVVSDGEKGIARSVRLLLGAELLESPNVTTIKVPPVTNAMMRRRLREVLTLEGFSISRDGLEDVVTAANGDIRAALNGLQFSVSHPRRVHSLPNSSQASAGHKRVTKRKRYQSVQGIRALAAIGQDITLSTYHAVAKILNNKRDEEGLSSRSAEDILHDARTDPSAFLSFLHHNYPSFFGDVKDMVPVLECLSDADCLLAWRQDDLARTGLADCAASVVTRGFLHHNTSPIQTGWRPIRGPDSYATAKEGQSYVEEAQRRFSGILAPVVYTRSTVCETIPFAEQVTRCPIKQWGVLEDGDGTLRLPLVDAAEVAMVDIESSQNRVPNRNLQATSFLNASERLAPRNDVEDVEEWDD